ncbi:MAG: Rieske 2Fe-2S domain-containing protein [Gemmatimonadota bacterium]|nr:Rieske 2Fe-2S domain-containing protein [Gemmatimonadota bacterium]
MSGSVSDAAGFVRAAARRDIDAAVPLGVVLPDGRRVCLVRDGETVYAVADRCPHRDFAISGGDVVAPCVLECPWHGAHFDVRTGAVLSGPCTDDLVTYAVQIAGGDVLVGPRRA